MEERKTVQFKKDEFAIRNYIRENLGKGKVSRVKITYTPVGEKVIVSTHKPGLVIGRKGENIERLTNILKTKFKMENPHIEIDEVTEPFFDAQLQADEIALALERLGPLKFKVIAYRTLQNIIRAGALGVEIRLSGKLPSSRAKTWRFGYGYLKKTGDSSKVVDRAQARAETKPGTCGIKVAILSPKAKMLDRIKVDEALLEEIKLNVLNAEEEKSAKKTQKSLIKK